MRYALGMPYLSHSLSTSPGLDLRLWLWQELSTAKAQGGRSRPQAVLPTQRCHAATPSAIAAFRHGLAPLRGPLVAESVPDSWYFLWLV